MVLIIFCVGVLVFQLYVLIELIKTNKETKKLIDKSNNTLKKWNK